MRQVSVERNSNGWESVSSILVAILSLSHSSPSYLRTAISTYGVSLEKIVINGDDDNDDGNGNNDEELNYDNDDGNGNNDEELNDEDTLGGNPSFGFIKIGLDDFEKQPSQEGTDAEKESVDPTQRGTVVELNPAEYCEIMSTPKNYTQWLARNADLVGEIIDAIIDEYLYGDLFGDNSVRMEVSNQGSPTPDIMSTRASNASASPGRRIVKPSSYLLSPYINKKTKVVSKITRIEFSVGNSLFAMQGDNIVYRIRLNLETFAPGLWIDANVSECWGAILNHKEKFRDAKSKSSQNLCLMVHCLLMMTNEEASQIKLRLNLKAMKMIWPFKALTCLTSTTSMTILDNTVANYDTKYKEVCDLLDCGLSVESGLQCDLLRRLRFKLATKILLHEINVHSRKMLELSNEFDKVDSLERTAIIVETVKNRRNVIASNYLVTKNIFCCVIQGIDIESQEIDQESQEIHLESHGTSVYFVDG
nr:hypothetical protein [Tanacetum cinerariifolium]